MASEQPSTPAATPANASREVDVDPHHITLDKAPEPAATTGKTFEDFELVQRKLVSEQPSTPVATPTNVSREVEVDPHHITLDEAPKKGSVPEGQTADFMAAHQQLQQKPHDDLVAMLNEKARTGKGLNQAEFNQVNDYISKLTDKAELKELKGLLAGKKMTSVQKKQLKEAIKNKEKALNSVATPDAETPAVTQKDGVEAPKVSKESIDADVKSIADSEIPSVQRKLWSDCKQRISDITNELSAPFKGNKAAMVAKCKTLFADLKTIAAKASASVRQKINNLMQKIRTMMSENKLIKNYAEKPKVVQAAPDDVEVISVEPARVGDVEVLDMGDMPPFMIRTFNAYSSQIDNVTSLRELNQIENSIVEMVDPQVKKALLNKINQKRAEI